MTNVLKRFHLASQKETDTLGAVLSGIMGRGDCLLLKGEIGAGKSTLARAFIRARLGQDTDVPSPTFTLVQIYEDAACDIWHADLYRLGDAQEAVELGLTEAMIDQICLIEWPEILHGLAPIDALTIELTAGENGHLAVLSGDPSWQNRLKGLNL